MKVLNIVLPFLALIQPLTALADGDLEKRVEKLEKKMASSVTCSANCFCRYEAGAKAIKSLDVSDKTRIDAIQKLRASCAGFCDLNKDKPELFIISGPVRIENGSKVADHILATPVNACVKD